MKPQAHDLTHASFFSGVGGLDMGLERAGWRTVSFSEIDPYASAVLAERWPGVPNLGSIVPLVQSEQRPPRRAETRRALGAAADSDWRRSTLWTGGFPCQDLSVAGKRRGFTGERSVLAFAFLDLVGRHRPPAVLLENVPGLLSSHGGRDLGALLGTLGQLGYWWAYRVLDARHFGVPQRRRRVFILALDAQRHPDPDCAAAVLAVGSRCDRHPPTGVEAGPGAADGAGGGIAGAVLAREGKGIGHNYPDDHLIGSVAPGAKGWRGMRGDGADPIDLGSSPDPGGVRAADGLAGRPHDRVELAATLNSGGNDGGFRTEPGEHIVVSPTPRVGPARIEDVPIVPIYDIDGSVAFYAPIDEHPLLLLGLDSHRYRCCGNGVVSSVSEWIGMRLAAYLA